MYFCCSYLRNAEVHGVQSVLNDQAETWNEYIYRLWTESTGFFPSSLQCKEYLFSATACMRTTNMAKSAIGSYVRKQARGPEAKHLLLLKTKLYIYIYITLMFIGPCIIVIAEE